MRRLAPLGPPALAMIAAAARQAKRGSRRPRFALDLGAMHDPARIRVEGVAPVHSAAVVPEHEIAHPPDVFPGEFASADELPQLVEKRFRLREREPYQVGVAAAP